MKKTLVISLCLLVAAAVFAPLAVQAQAAPAPAAPANAQLKIRYINMERIFQEYYKTLEKDNAFKAKKQSIDNNVKEEIKKLEALATEAKAARETSTKFALSQEERDKALSKARDLEMQAQRAEANLKDYAGNAGKGLQAEYISMRNEIVDYLIKFIKVYAKQDQIEMIIDVSGMTANALPVIIAYDENKEITDLVIQTLNQGHEPFVKTELEKRRIANTPAAPAAPAKTDAPAAPAKADGVK
jgi:Skp family chaperone for outer membrane proteins